MTHAPVLARLLEIRAVEVVIGKDRIVTFSTVRCPIRGRSAPIEECASCREGGAIAHDTLARGGYLACRGTVPVACSAPPPGDGVTVAEVIRRTAVALRPGVARGVASDALRARGEPAAPVVDGEGRPIGLVAEADLLRAPPRARVADAMTRIALAVHESAPLARAASLMAAHRLERLAVVGADGVVVGVLSTADVLGWLYGTSAPLATADAPGARRA